MSVWHGGTILKAITAATQAYEQQSTALNRSPTPQQTTQKHVVSEGIKKRKATYRSGSDYSGGRKLKGCRNGHAVGYHKHLLCPWLKIQMPQMFTQLHLNRFMLPWLMTSLFSTRLSNTELI